MATDIAWDLYRSFLGVLSEGSLSGAARALGIAQPTVGRHVAALEQALGLVLFTRSQTGLLPTEAALALQTHAEAMASTAAALERTAASQGEGKEIRGVVRVTASEVVGVEVLPPIIANLRERHPALKLELVLSNRVQDLLQREADIAVRMTRPEQKQLVARHVGTIELGLHASKDYVQRYGKPAKMEELARHALIGFDKPTAFIRNAAKSLRGVGREHFSLRTDSDLAQLALIRAGAGIGICQAGLALRSNALERILPRQFQMKLDTWITMHEDLRHSPRCKVTFDALAAGLLDYADADAGATRTRPARTRR